MLFERVYQDLIDRRNRVINGDINCIPFPFRRFRGEYPGIEQGKYFLLTANSKVGKTQIADFLCMYDPFFYAFNHRDKVKIRIFYFTLEIKTMFILINFVD